MGDKFILTEYGFTTEPGRWDHWPGGFLATLAAEQGVNGRVVMEADDIVFPLREFTGERIAFDISDGMVTEISGGARADHLRDFIEGYNDPRAYAVSHIGWGLNHQCIWRPDLPGIGMDGRAHYGNVLFSLGPDTEFGGENDTPCHLDLPMQGCSLWLDDELIVENGAGGAGGHASTRPLTSQMGGKGHLRFRRVTVICPPHGDVIVWAPVTVPAPAPIQVHDQRERRPCGN